MNTKIIKFDINKNLYDTLIAKQGDTKSRFLLFNLLDGSIPFSLENRSVRVYAVKPDRTEVFNDLIITDAAKGYCILELTTQMLAVAGTVKLELMVIEDEKKLTSNIFYMDVKKSINSEKAVVSTNEFGALLTALSSLNEYDNYKNEIKNARGGQVNLKTRLDNFDEQLDTIESNSATKLEVDVERKRINLLTKVENNQTEGNTELLDIRISALGVEKATAGDSVRDIEREIVKTPIFTDGEMKKSANINKQCVQQDGSIKNDYYNNYYVAYYNVSDFRSIILNAFSGGGAPIRNFAFYSVENYENVSNNNLIYIDTYTDNTDKNIIVPFGTKILAVSHYQDNCKVIKKSFNIEKTFEYLNNQIIKESEDIDNMKSEIYQDKHYLIEKTYRNLFYFNNDGTQGEFSTYCNDVFEVDGYYKAIVTARTTNNFKPYILLFKDSNLSELYNYITYSNGVEIEFEIPSDVKYIAINTTQSQTTSFKAIKNESKISSNDDVYKGIKISGIGDSLSTGFTYLDKCVTDLGMIKAGVQKGGECISGTSSNAFWQSSVINKLDNDSKIKVIFGGTNDVFQNKPIGEISITNCDTNTFVGAYNVLITKLYYKYLGLANGYYSNITYNDINQIESPYKALPIILIKPPMCLTEGKFDKIIEIGEVIEKIGYMWGLPVIESNKIFANPITLTSTDLIHGVMANFNYLGNLIVNTLRLYSSSMTFFNETLGQQYNISTSITDGKISVNNTAREGDIVNFVVEKESYSSISITGNILVTTVDASKNSYSFVMPSNDVIITVS